MQDWRGNTYEEEKLWKQTNQDGLQEAVICEECNKEQAVRNCCTAEGDVARTHWHGAVHIKGELLQLCKVCCKKLQEK